MALRFHISYVQEISVHPFAQFDATSKTYNN